MYHVRQKSFAAAFALLTVAGFARAEVLDATITTFSSPYVSYLVSFNTNNPGTFLSSVQFNGADLGTPASGNPNGQQFVVSGIDFRPGTGQLYAMGYRSGFEQRTYTVDPTTGIATTLPNTIFIGASSASFTIDPQGSAIRVTSDQQSNQHLDPATGAATADTTLAYVAGDVNAGATPRVASASYTYHGPSVPPQYALVGIDARGAGTLVLIGTPGPTGSGSDGNGQLHTIGPLNLSFPIPTDSQVAFYIANGGDFAAIEPSLGAPSHLFSIDPASGVATDLGQIGPNGTAPVWGLTTAPVPEPGSLALVSVAAGAAAWAARRRRSLNR